jgi:hypothetical protein
MTHTPRFEFALPLPITQAARETAQAYANQQLTLQKAEQVRLNTLAVQVTQKYLEMMDIATDLAAADSWNPIMRWSANVADLVIPTIGRLECRPVRSQDTTCSIPPEVWEERIGYAVVQIDDSLETAQFLGFIQSVQSEEVSLTALRSPEELLEHLYTLSQSTLVGVDVPTLAGVNQMFVNLGQWLQNTFEAGWETVESLLNPPEPAYATGAFRSASSSTTPLADRSVYRAKQIDLPEVNQSLVLVVGLNPIEQGQTNVNAQICPLEDLLLPPGLQFVLLDETGDVLLEQQATGNDISLELQSEFCEGDRFQIQLNFLGVEVTERFVV